MRFACSFLSFGTHLHPTSPPSTFGEVTLKATAIGCETRAAQSVSTDNLGSEFGPLRSIDVEPTREKTPHVSCSVSSSGPQMPLAGWVVRFTVLFQRVGWVPGGWPSSRPGTQGPPSITLMRLYLSQRFTDLPDAFVEGLQYFPTFSE